MCDIARTIRLGRLLDRPTDPHVNRKLVSLFSIKIASTQATKFVLLSAYPKWMICQKMFIKSRFKSAKVHIRLMCDIARTFRLSRLPDRPSDPLLRHLTSSPSTSDSLFNWWKILRQGPTGTRQKLEGMEEIFLLPCNKYRKTRLTARTTTYFYALFTLSKKPLFFKSPHWLQ